MASQSCGERGLLRLACRRNSSPSAGACSFAVANSLSGSRALGRCRADLATLHPLTNLSASVVRLHVTPIQEGSTDLLYSRLPIGRRYNCFALSLWPDFARVQFLRRANSDFARQRVRPGFSPRIFTGEDAFACQSSKRASLIVECETASPSARVLTFYHSIFARALQYGLTTQLEPPRHLLRRIKKCCAFQFSGTMQN